MRPVALFCLFVATSLSIGAEPEVTTLPEDVARKMTFLNPDYVVYRPQTPEPARPLIVYLHGAGGRGPEVEKAANNVARFRGSMIQTLGEVPSIDCWIVAPQCSKGTAESMGIWMPEDLDRFLGHLRATLPFDPERVYLTGTSMGGYGSWAWAAHSPGHFAAVAPVVGGLGRGGPKDISPELDRWAEALVPIPVWAFHGAQDRVVPADRSEKMVGLIREKGGTRAKLTIYPDEGHGAGGKVFNSPEFYQWLFAQKRSSQP
jgi:predicted peptidase